MVVHSVSHRPFHYHSQTNNALSPMLSRRNSVVFGQHRHYSFHTNNGVKKPGCSRRSSVIPLQRNLHHPHPHLHPHPHPYRYPMHNNELECGRMTERILNVAMSHQPIMTLQELVHDHDVALDRALGLACAAGSPLSLITMYGCHLGTLR